MVSSMSKDESSTNAQPQIMTSLIYLILIGSLFNLCAFVPSTSAEETCQANAWPPHRPDADVRFALLISKNFSTVTEDCKLTSAALQHYLAVEWIVENFNAANNGTGYIPGTTLGFDGLNDCSMPQHAARNSVSFSSKYLPHMTSECSAKEANATHAGFVMVSESRVAKEVASIMSDSPVPIVSALATVPELSNSKDYPNFFRTVPSDIHQMDFITDMLERFHWSYIVVAYQDNLYGKSSLDVLTQKAEEKNICIYKSLKLPGNSFEIGGEFKEILSTAKDESIAVVVIADVQQSQGFLCDLHSPREFSSKRIHFIMTEAVNRHVFEERCKPNSWMITVSTEADVELDDLKVYINTKYRENRDKALSDRHPIISEYLKLDSAPSSGELVEGSLAPYITSTLHSVIAIVEAVKALHQEECFGTTHVCEAMKLKIKEKRLITLMRSNTVDYDEINLGVLKGGVAFTFNQDSTDILPVRNMNEYTAYYFLNDQYQSIGSYLNEKTQMDMRKLATLSPNYFPLSVCAGRCDSCLHKGKIPTLYLEGDVYILGVFSLHESNLFECGSWRQTGNDAFIAEGFIYAVEQLREKTGINFGAIGFDDCYSPLRIISILTDYMSNINPSNHDMFPYNIPREKIVGAIGCRPSGCTLAIASVLMPMKIPLISYASSSPDLDDRINYPLFLRTVPSDVFQAQVMVDIIKANGWEYVGLLYVKNNYGSKGMLAFRNIVDQEGSGVCVPQEFGISEENNAQLDTKVFADAYYHFIILKVKVVVFFGIDERFKSFIQNMEANKNRLHGKFIFLGSEDWGKNRKILEAGVESARGSITLKLQEVNRESEISFKEHLKNKRPNASDPNIWYSEFWQNHFGCNFKGGLINVFERECNSSLKLSNDQISNYVSDQRLIHAMNAVYAMGNAFKSIKENQCNGKFPCSYLTSNPQGTRDEILKQTMTIGEEGRPLFDENGNGAVGFDVHNIQKLDGGTYDYVKVGTFSRPGSSQLSVNAIKFYNDTGGITKIEAKCTDDLCNKCRYKPPPPVTLPPNPEEGEQSSDDYKDSDIVIISLIIVLILAIAVVFAGLFICFQRKCKDFEKNQANKGDDQIYAEPDRHVYPGPYNASGNGLVFSDPNFSPYQDSTYRTTSHATSNQSGLGHNNLAYSPDSENVDSVSQVIASRRQVHNDSGTHGNMSEMDSPAHKSLRDSHNVESSPAVPRYAGRPLPSTVNDGESVHTWAPPTSSIVSEPQFSRRPMSEPSQISVISSPSGIHDPALSGKVFTVPYTSAPGAIRSNSHASEPVTYYIRDENGQLTALVQPNPAPRASIDSDAFSVNADHGPYSHALAQQKLIDSGQRPISAPQMAFHPQQIIAVPISTVIPPPGHSQMEMVEMKDMAAPMQTYSPKIPQSHQGHVNQTQAIIETPLTKNSPVHYASPIHAPSANQEGDYITVHHPANPLSYPNQPGEYPMSDPHPTSHRRQLSNHHWQVDQQQQQHPENTAVAVPDERFSRSASCGPLHFENVDRDEMMPYPEPSNNAVPDVIAGSPSGATALAHLDDRPNSQTTSGGPGLPVDNVKYYQMLKDQLPQAGMYSPISNV